jgi:hypothetical protein
VLTMGLIIPLLTDGWGKSAPPSLGRRHAQS